MGDECKHGLDDGLCAICFPKATPEPQPKAAPVRRVLTPRGTRVTPPRVPSKTAAKAADVGVQRLYHVTHINNLAPILASGHLVSDLHLDGAAERPARPVVDVSAPAARDARRSAHVAGAPVAGFVPFFLSPHARVWDAIRNREADSRLAPEARSYVPSEFVILVTSVNTVAGEATADADVAVSDGDAAGALTRIAAGRESAERMLGTLRAEDESGRILDAEFLVKDGFPFEAITLVGVSDEKVRDVVKRQLADSGFAPKVAVYPPWFRSVDEPLA